MYIIEIQILCNRQTQSSAYVWSANKIISVLYGNNKSEKSNMYFELN